MVIFVDEDRAYRSWLAHHRHGYVLDGYRRPTRQAPVAHAASCELIQPAKGKKSRGTGGRHYKACALDLAELLAWAEAEAEHAPRLCEACRPNEGTPAAEPRRLTPLGKDVVDYVVDVAVLCLDERRAYRLTVGDIATYLAKTPGQLRQSLQRLVEDGYLRPEGPYDAAQGLATRRRVFPTALALRTLPYYQHLPPRKVKAELAQLDGRAG